MIMNKIHIFKRGILFESRMSKKTLLIGKGLSIIRGTFDIVSES